MGNGEVRDSFTPQVVARFKAGVAVEVSDLQPSTEYQRIVRQVEGLERAVQKLGAGSSAQQAAAVEFVLEGLHLNKRLNKDKVAGRAQYRG